MLARGFVAGVRGRRVEGCATWRELCDDGVDDVAGDFCDVAVFDELEECAFQRGLADVFQDLRRGPVSDDAAFSQNDELRADFFDDFEDVGAEEDGFAFVAQGLDERFEDERGGYVESGERLVEDEDVGLASSGT